jgi:hypothetical protein
MSAEAYEPEGSQLEIPLDERIATAVAVAYGEAGFATEMGRFDAAALTDALLPLILHAEAKQKSDRARVGVTRRAMMQHAFPKVLGPEDHADAEDPALAEGVYDWLDAACWRQTAMKSDGAIQARLNSEHGLVLCRTRVNPNKTWAVYVTRDLGCLLEDAIKPQRADQKKRADRDAAFTAMLIERIPEHGKRFNRELVGGLQTALGSAKAITAGVLTASVFDDADGVDEDGE